MDRKPVAMLKHKSINEIVFFDYSRRNVIKVVKLKQRFDIGFDIGS
ncbi:hypothetical protein [Candidatus Sodalis pierantonius]|nr:hypothetical protein [Candidatus Sodalis pierantonius]